MRSALLCAVLLALSGCALEIPRKPATLDASSDAGQAASIQVDEDAVVRLASGYSRRIKAGSTWKRVGALQGQDVYKLTGDVFTIEGSHVHEAYLLLDGNSLSGFFLPGDNAVSWLNRKVPLKFH